MIWITFVARLCVGNSPEHFLSVILQPDMESHRFYKSKTLQVGEFKRAFEQAVTAVLGPDSVILVTHSRNIGDSDVTDVVKVGVENLQLVTDLNNINLALSASTPSTSPRPERVSMFCKSAAAGVISCCVPDQESMRCRERFVSNLGLEQTDDPALAECESKISAILENIYRRIPRILKCFISFKFDDSHTITQVDRLKRLLDAVHIEWVTGEQFEPRRIEDKVKARLRADIDFIIAVITKAGESKWIRDELADANARDLWVVVLLEDGATFDKGIFGTLEYITYDLVIDQTFSALLEGVNFIRAEISAKGEENSD